MDGSPTSTFGLQLPVFLSKLEDYLESLMRILGGGEPLATVVRVGSDTAYFAGTRAAAAKAAGQLAATATATAASSSSTAIQSIADAVSAVISSAASGTTGAEVGAGSVAGMS
ncbi:hypothetical protein BGX28_007097 [Mortierella sp. GBA30]|nr:hypothetical protein BGX28_007097 [Mortierella sp. GBA30]